jgi:glucose-1-phosphate cytidylyltransferase
MKVVILAGGFGTRISEETHLIPKPMITIGDKPILIHLMEYFSIQGYTDFIILAGYKQEVIKSYFNNLILYSNDVTYDYRQSLSVRFSNYSAPQWTVTILDSGLETMTGGRLLYLKDYVDDKFILTYGDGLSDINISELKKFHFQSGSLLTISAVKPYGRFGQIEIKSDGLINEFREKSKNDSSWINGGFMMVDKEILNYIQSAQSVLETDVFNTLISQGNLSAFKHYGYWQCMDTLKDRQLLENTFREGNAPWRVIKK